MTKDEELTKIHFDHVCAQTNYFNDKLTEAFTFFVTTFSVIVGGSVWLAFQDKAHGLPNSTKIRLSDAVVVLLTLVTLARVIGNLTAWWGARCRQNKMLASVPLPYKFWSTWLEIALALSVIGACIIFLSDNPFSLLPAN